MYLCLSSPPKRAIRKIHKCVELRVVAPHHLRVMRLTAMEHFQKEFQHNRNKSARLCPAEACLLAHMWSAFGHNDFKILDSYIELTRWKPIEEVRRARTCVDAYLQALGSGFNQPAKKYQYGLSDQAYRTVGLGKGKAWTTFEQNLFSIRRSFLEYFDVSSRLNGDNEGKAVEKFMGHLFCHRRSAVAFTRRLHSHPKALSRDAHHQVLSELVGGFDGGGGGGGGGGSSSRDNGGGSSSRDNGGGGEGGGGDNGSGDAEVCDRYMSLSGLLLVTLCNTVYSGCIFPLHIAAEQCRGHLAGGAAAPLQVCEQRYRGACHEACNEVPHRRDADLAIPNQTPADSTTGTVHRIRH